MSNTVTGPDAPDYSAMLLAAWVVMFMSLTALFYGSAGC